MQEREVWNGRLAMVAVVVFAIEEVVAGKGIVDIGVNDFFFKPVFAIPAFQAWLDSLFQTASVIPS